MAQERRMFSDLNLIGNFTNEAVKLGNIYLMDDNDFSLVGNIADFDRTIKVKSLTESSEPANRKLQNTKSTAINTSANADSPIGTEEFELLFSKKNAGIIFLKNAVTHSLKYGLINDKLQKIWAEEGYDKHPMRYCMVSQLISAESGTVLISCEAKNRVVLQHDGNMPVKNADVLINGNFSIQVNTKRTNEIISKKAISPVFQAMRFKKNGMAEIVA